jgi:nitrous oxidase accessory protein NosD
LEEFRLPTKGEKKILYVCENCEYKDLKKALDDADIGDTIMITDKREYENEVIDKLGIVIDCGGSSLRIDDIKGSNIILKNCKLSPIKYDIDIHASNIEITDSTIFTTDFYSNIDCWKNKRIVLKNNQINNLTIHLFHAEDVEIKNNQITPGYVNFITSDKYSLTYKTGMKLDGCKNIKIEGNTIGIVLPPHPARVSEISISGWNIGIEIENSSKIFITENKIMNFEYGIWSDSQSKDIEVRRNSFTGVKYEYAAQAECKDHLECSQACTSLCPTKVYGCCYGCKLGQCINGKCECVEAVDYCSRNPNYQVGSPCTR